MTGSETVAKTLEDIWEGDKLKRREEALLLERFLSTEAAFLAGVSRDQAVVLALDAQYGEGKSWFLSRFKDQLEINYPVAFVDAWIDDANNEPLVSIMSALDDALRPFLRSRSVKERVGALTRAALPIIGKAAIGAGGKFVGRYIGEHFGGVADEAIKQTSRKSASSLVEVGVDKVTDGISDVVDKAGKALLDQYRSRQHSRKAFKDTLRQLAAAINSDEANSKQAPIFIIVDELDRCRPSYAISLLEEVKHLFDVPGVAFIIALHGDQLEHSVKAVYGEGFSAKSYLRRFFTRTYELRRLSKRELVESHFSSIRATVKFSMPQTWVGPNIVPLTPSQAAGRLLSEWFATPREIQAVIDGLRLFSENWDMNTSIELPLVLTLLLSLVRGDALDLLSRSSSLEEISFVYYYEDERSGRQTARARFDELNEVYKKSMANSLISLLNERYLLGLNAYLYDRLRDESSARFGNSFQSGQNPMSTWSEYPSRVQELGRFVDTEYDGRV